ncbi:plasmid stabilization protein [Kribbella sp. NPDC023855]|uniref:FitA-like ribbon-helix-helix domain-containing protein n=1 Tax=Kribbella sp. NPDC023855 TaxID=3154698 RepID=UPI0033D62E12
MAVITVRNLDDEVKQRLRVRAARNGHSMEAEARAIIVAAVAEEDEPKNILMRLRESAAELGGVELDIPPRDGTMRVVDFGE